MEATVIYVELCLTSVQDVRATGSGVFDDVS